MAEGISMLVYRVFYVLVLIAGVSWAILSVKDYSEKLYKLQEKREEYTNLYNIACIDAEKARKAGMADKCKDLAFNITKNPWLYAIYDVAGSWGMCEMIGCRYVLEKYTNQCLAFLIVVAILWMLFIRSVPINRNEMYAMPMTDECGYNKKKKM